MRGMRLVAVLCIIAVLAMLAGCRASWVMDFTEAEDADMADWGGYTSWTLNDPEGSGLTVYEDYVMTPLGFPSDFTLTIWMTMEINEIDNADFRIWIGDDDSSESEHYIECVFSEAGDEDNEKVLIHEDGVGIGYRDVDTLAPIPGLRSGDNVFKLVRNGDHFRITVNGALLASFDALYFDPAACYVAFVTRDTSDVDIYYTKIKVDYEGDTVPLP